jgi:thiol-disulfide isomerase/thioredoxin
MSPRLRPVAFVVVALGALSGGGRALRAAEAPARIADRMRGRAIAAQLPPLDNPAHKPRAAASQMRDEDWVLGVVVGGRACAYPWWVVKNYHVVNDTIAGVPLAVSFCEQCTGGAAFKREHDGRVLSMAVAGVYNGTILLKDRDTGTLWAPFSGRGLEGPLAGERLERIPLTLAHWDEWALRHPTTEVVDAPPSARSGHGAWYRPGKWGIVTEMGSTLETWDPRLPENTLVYGVESAAGGKAYPLTAVVAHGGVVQDQVTDTPVVVIARGEIEGAGFDRRLGGRVLSFRPAAAAGGASASASDAVAADSETGSTWSLDGEALAGPLRGQRLRPLDGYTVEWHVWSAYNPRTELFGAKADAAGGPANAPSLPAGAALPSLALPDLDGRVRDVPLVGETNLVVLWAAWCPPCRAEMPQVEALVKKHAGADLAAVGIAIHIPEPIERDVVRGFVAESKITFPIFLVDDAGYDALESLAIRLGGPGLVLPTVFVTDRQGTITAVFRGKEAEGLAAAIEARLGSASHTSTHKD